MLLCMPLRPCPPCPGHVCCRESELVKEVERRREEAREARAEAVRAQDINRSMLAARRGAREAISDIAQMNARLCALYLDAKHDLKQAASKHEDEHRQWQVPGHRLAVSVFDAALFAVRSSTARVVALASAVESRPGTLCALQGVIGELEDSLRAANQQRVACCQLMGGTPPAARHQALAGSLDPCMPCPASHSPDPYCTPPQASPGCPAPHTACGRHSSHAGPTSGTVYPISLRLARAGELVNTRLRRMLQRQP